MTVASRSLSGRTPSYGDATTANLPAVSPRVRMHRPSGQLSARSMELLEARGLDAELCVRLELETASAPDGGGDWIAIPFRKGGATVNHKYRRVNKSDAGPNFAQDKGGAQIFWNYDAITDPSLARVPLVITEGEFDAMAAIQAGFARAVSVPGGAPQQAVGDKDSGKYAFVADSLDDLADVTDIILAVDGDGPGIALMNDLALRLGRARCRYVVYHEGCKDLGDVLRRHGTRGVAEAINAARWVSVKGLFRMSELPPAPAVDALRTGIPQLDEHYKIRRGDFAVITGIPGHGKTTVVNEIACRMAERHLWSTAFASFEQDPLGDHRRALRTWYNRVPEREQTPEQLLDADMWIDRHFSFLVPSEDEDADLPWMLETMAAAVIRHGIDMAVIDPWNEMDHAKPRDQSLTEYVGWAIRQIKKFGKKYGVHMMVVAHPTKISKDREGKVPMPTLYDISDCYSDDTEALTKRGWLRHQEISTEDEVLCFDPSTGRSIWERPSRVVRHRHDGDMVSFRGAGYDLLVSPNHRMLVKPIWAEPKGTQAITGRGRPVRWPKDAWSFVEARQLATLGSPFKIPKAALAQEADYPDRLVIGDRDYPAPEFLELVGWWIAEGCFQSAGASLCQAEGPGAERIDLLVSACGIDATRATRVDPRGFLPMATWYFGAKTNRALVEWLRDKCGDGAAYKKVPYPVWGLHPYLKASLLNGYIAGDGCRRSGGRSGYGIAANTTSRQLFDDLQRLAVELGIPVCGGERVVVNERHNRSWYVLFGTDNRREVTMRSSRNVSVVPYNGEIWCLTVPTGAYVVRRNGKVSISGNSAAWFNKCDVGVIVHREEGRTKVRVAKTKYHDIIGTPGTAFLSFDKWSGRYVEAAP